MDNNFRTVKKSDLEHFINNVFRSHGVDFVNFEIRSFYLVFFDLRNGDSGIRAAFSDLYKRGIITEEPISTNYGLPEMFIHPFIIAEEASKVDK